MRNFKILGLSLLALVGVLAVSASAAQANWKLLENGVAKSLLALVGTINLNLMLVRSDPGDVLLFAFHCTGGTFTAHLKTENAAKELKIPGTILLGEGTAIFTGCVLKDSKGTVNKNCTVHSPGKAAGTIEAKGAGTGSMEGAKTYALLESSEFTFIEIDGALCPLNESDAEVSGSVDLTIDEPEKSLATHTGSLSQLKLNYGTNLATFMPNLTENGAIKGSAKLANGNTWAIDLCGLPTPAC